LEDDPLCEHGERTCSVFLVIKSEPQQLGDRWPRVLPLFLDYHWAKDWPGARFDFRRYGPACGLTSLLSSDYIFRLEPGSPGEGLCFHAWSRLLENPPKQFAAAYQEIASFELHAGKRGTLMKRVERTTEEQARAAAVALKERLASRTSGHGKRGLGRNGPPAQEHRRERN
jgi:hypothetical protein